jgi:hypothetical protein
MKHDREFDTSYFHNPIVQGLNHSLYIMLLKEMASMESRRQPGAAPKASPLPSYPSSLQTRMVYFVLLRRPATKSPKGSFI